MEIHENQVVQAMLDNTPISMQWCICVILHIYMFFERWTAFILLYACCRYWLIELESFYVPSCRCRYSRVKVISVNHGVSWLIDRFEPMGRQYHYYPIFSLVENNGIKHCLFNTKMIICNWCLNHRDLYLVILFRFSSLWMYSLSCCWRPDNVSVRAELTWWASRRRGSRKKKSFS